MSFDFPTILSILSIIFVILNFVFNRNDKSGKEISELSYKQGKTDMLFNNIMEKLDKIEKKLDFYDKEIEDKVTKAINHHVEVYHKGE